MDGVTFLCIFVIKNMCVKRIILFDIANIPTEVLFKQGIYKIINTITDDFYIGSASRSFNERFKEHCGYYAQYLAKTKTILDNPILWRAFDKYNITNFKVEILEVINTTDKNEILKREEYYINKLKPLYNICKEPTKGGSPNKNKKLTKEWKNNIAKKSANYTHSPETLKIVTKNNKNNSVRLKFTSEIEVLIFKSWVEAEKYFGVTSSAIKVAFARHGKWKEYNIIKLSNQRKKIKVNNIIFDSYNACDRHFNMWRGYTSTCIKYNNLIIDKYTYELI